LEIKRWNRSVAPLWRTDETNILVKRKSVYLYRAVDKFGNTIDLILFERRDEEVVTVFFKQAMGGRRSSASSIFHSKVPIQRHQQKATLLPTRYLKCDRRSK
jgi:transposase-like protein